MKETTWLSPVKDSQVESNAKYGSLPRPWTAAASRVNSSDVEGPVD